MRTTAIVIAALLGYASAQSVLSPAQQAKKEKLESEIKDLVDDIEKTKTEFKTYAEAKQKRDEANKEAVAKKVDELKQGFNTVNQKYADAFQNVKDTVKVSKTAHGFDQYSTGTQAQQAQIVDKLQGAANADNQNIEGWAQLLDDQYQRSQKEDQQFKNQFQDNVKEIKHDIHDIMREADRPVQAVEVPETTSLWQMSPAQKAHNAKINQEIKDFGNKVEGILDDAEPIVKRSERYTKTNVRILENDMHRAEHASKRVNHLYEHAYNYAGNDIRETHANGWGKLGFQHPHTVVHKFNYAAAADKAEGKREEREFNRFVNRQKFIENQKKHSLQAKVGQRVSTLDDDLRKIIRDIEASPQTQALSLTTINVDDAKMKTADAKLKQLGGEWDQFAKEKKLDQQVNAWLEEKNAKQKIEHAQKETDAFLKDLAHKNKIAEWAQEHRANQRMEEVKNIVRSGVEVTRNAQVLETMRNTQYSQDEIMILAAFGVVVMAALAAGLQKLRGDKKTDKFEFEVVDTEMAPTPKESKKAIKNTLKNIMSKNNAKTTLIH